ncbi:MAG TPA: hypothetical protein VF682_25940 [Pseudomonas sp.]|jgi:hypothetical protein
MDGLGAIDLLGMGSEKGISRNDQPQWPTEEEAEQGNGRQRGAHGFPGGRNESTAGQRGVAMTLRTNL